eukprot:COSAG01_NODE_72519_length_252_cov_4.620915_1_plen_73_part_01
MAVDELSTPYHPAPAYFDDAAPYLLAAARCGDDYMLADTMKTEDLRLKNILQPITRHSPHHSLEKSHLNSYFE